MKKFLRICALVLALVMLVSVFAACKGDNNGETPTTETPTTTEKPKPTTPPIDGGQFEIPTTLPISIAGDLKLDAHLKTAGVLSYIGTREYPLTDSAYTFVAPTTDENAAFGFKFTPAVGSFGFVVKITDGTGAPVGDPIAVNFDLVELDVKAFKTDAEGNVYGYICNFANIKIVENTSYTITVEAAEGKTMPTITKVAFRHEPIGSLQYYATSFSPDNPLAGREGLIKINGGDYEETPAGAVNPLDWWYVTAEPSQTGKHPDGFHYFSKEGNTTSQDYLVNYIDADGNQPYKDYTEDSPLVTKITHYYLRSEKAPSTMTYTFTVPEGKEGYYDVVYRFRMKDNKSRENYVQIDGKNTFHQMFELDQASFKDICKNFQDTFMFAFTTYLGAGEHTITMGITSSRSEGFFHFRDIFLAPTDKQMDPTLDPFADEYINVPNEMIRPVEDPDPSFEITGVPAADENAASVATGTADTTWYAAGTTAFTLTTADQLIGFFKLLSEGTNFEGVTVTLGADMILNTATDIANGTLKYVQVETANEFKGTFDGAGKYISGVTFKNAAGNAGMFGTLNGATIKSLYVLNASMTTTIAGESKSAYIASSVKGNSTISDVYVNGTTYETEGNKFAKAAGLVASIEAGVTLTLTNVTFEGSINISGEYAGGLVGEMLTDAKVVITNGKVKADIYAKEYVGGYVAYAESNEAVTWDENTLFNGTVGAPATGWRVRKHVGYRPDETEPTTPQKPAPTTPDTTWYNETDNAFTLNNVAEFLGFNKLMAEGKTFEGVTVTLGADIYVNEMTVERMHEVGPSNEWKAETVFKGTFDGANHVISGIYVDTNVETGAGLFGSASGTIKNVILINSYFNAPYHVGGLVGVSAATAATSVTPAVELNITNCIVDVEIFYKTRDKGAGGIIGEVLGPVNITNCGVAATISIATIKNTKAFMGGVAGRASNSSVDLTIKNCVVLSNLIMTGVDTSAGGVIGSVGSSAKVAIEGSVIAPVITLDDPKNADARAGGIVSMLSGGKTTIDVKDTVILGKVIVTSPKENTFYSIGALGGSMNGSKNENFTATNVLLAIDLEGRGAVFSMGYNGVTLGKATTITATNVVYVTDMVNNTNLSLDAEGNISTTAPEGTVAKTAAEMAGAAGATAMGANWTAVEGGLPVPTAAQALYAKMLAGDYIPAPVAPDTTWYNPEAESSTIEDLSDLLGFNQLLTQAEGALDFAGKTIVLGADIVVNADSLEQMMAAAPKWVWNGNGTFKGIFDGNNKTISGLYITGAEGKVGFFGSASGEIKNLNLEGYLVTENGKVGGLVGTPAGELNINGCIIDMTVEYDGQHGGGVLGYADNVVKITNTAFTGHVISNRDNTKGWAGGLVGTVQDGNVTAENCVVTGKIESTSGKSNGLGGFTSYVFGSSADSSFTVKSSIFDGEIIVTGVKADCRAAGAVAVVQGDGKAAVAIEDCIIAGKVTIVTPTANTYYTVGALTGSAHSYGSYTVKNSIIAMNHAGTGCAMSAGYNGTTWDKLVLEATFENVYYVTDMLNTTNLSGSASGPVAAAPAGTTAKVSADMETLVVGENWTGAMPTGVLALYLEVLGVGGDNNNTPDPAPTPAN